MAIGPVRSVKITATGAVLATQRARAKGLWLNWTALAGNIVLKDGGAGGETRIDLDTPAAVGAAYLDFGPEGIIFGTDVHCSTLTNMTATLIYG